MPYKRPTLTELREKNRAQLQSGLRENGTLLRFSNSGVLADVDAGLSHLHYGYLDYIAQQTTPFTSTDEWQAGWAALKGIFQKAAAPASSPAYQITGMAGTVVSVGAILNRGDGYQYRLDNAVIIGPNGKGSGAVTAILPASVDDDICGGSQGNAAAGTCLTLDIAWPGAETEGILLEPATGGTDIEDKQKFRSRMLSAYQNPPQGGSDSDYQKWALTVPGVTRCWVKRHLLGAGSVGVYIMCDDSNKNRQGFPNGTNGISQSDDWGAVRATGDQGRVADSIYPLQPVTARVYVCSPVAREIDFELQGISGADKSVTEAIASAIDQVFVTHGDPRGGAGIALSDLNRAIDNVPGTGGVVLLSPRFNITLDKGELPVRGRIVYL